MSFTANARRRLSGWSNNLRRLLKMDESNSSTNTQRGSRSPGVREEALSQDPGYNSQSEPTNVPSGILDENPAQYLKSTEQTEADGEEEGNQSTLPLSEEEIMKLTLAEELAEAKAKYKGWEDWAPDEERLFEILFMRQNLPIMPQHWFMDFRNFPIHEKVFDTQDSQPIIYSHCKNGMTEYRATNAITRMIDVSLSVNTLIESKTARSQKQQARLRYQGARLITNAIENLIDWAARDGGYEKRRMLPNVVVEMVDVDGKEEDIVDAVTTHMRSLIKKHREYYRVDRKPDFWDDVDTTFTQMTPLGRALRKKRSMCLKRKRLLSATPELDFEDELASEHPEYLVQTPKRQSKRCRIGSSRKGHGDDVPKWDKAKPSIEADTHNPWMTPPTIAVKVEDLTDDTSPYVVPRYTRSPSSDAVMSRTCPVVYGLYVLGLTVVVVTADAEKGVNAPISFQVDCRFDDKHQNVWNALTIATVVCLARDELMTRIDDFEPAETSYDSDPDA